MLAGKAKKVKDPNAPKKPLTTYMRYAATVRAGIREENPDFKVFVCVYISSPFAYMYASIYVQLMSTGRQPASPPARKQLSVLRRLVL